MKITPISSCLEQEVSNDGLLQSVL